MGTGKSRGFGFLCYMDQRSTVLSVDNLNGVKVLGRTIRVDHVHQYKLPKDLEKLDQDKRKLFEEGCAPKAISGDESESEEEMVEPDVPIKKKKEKKKRKRRYSSDSEEDRKNGSSDKVGVDKENKYGGEKKSDDTGVKDGRVPARDFSLGEEKSRDISEDKRGE